MAATRSENFCNSIRTTKSRGVCRVVATLTTDAPSLSPARTFSRSAASEGVPLKSWKEMTVSTRSFLAEDSNAPKFFALRSSTSTSAAAGSIAASICPRRAAERFPLPPSRGWRAVMIIGTFIVFAISRQRSFPGPRQSRRISTKSTPPPGLRAAASRRPGMVCAVATTRHRRGIRFLLRFMSACRVDRRSVLTSPTRTAVPHCP